MFHSVRACIELGRTGRVMSHWAHLDVEWEAHCPGASLVSQEPVDNRRHASARSRQTPIMSSDTPPVMALVSPPVPPPRVRAARRKRLGADVPRSSPALAGGLRWRHEDAVIMRHGVTRSVVAQTVAGPVAVTLPAHVLGEVIDRVPLLDAVILADAVLARHAAVAQEIIAGRNADPRCRRVARLAGGRAESPMETRLRLLLVLAGLPVPVLQHRVVIEGVTRRFDLAYPEHKIAIEYDGERHFMSEAAKHADAIRREAVARAGWATIGVVSHGVYADPAGTLERVVRQLAARGVRVEVSPGWEAHFTQRVRAA